MGRRPLDPVARVDAAVPSFVVGVELVNLTVQINAGSSQPAAKKRRVGMEDGGAANLARSALEPYLARFEENTGDRGHPLVKVDRHGVAFEPSNKLLDQGGAQIPKDDGIVGLAIIRVLEVGHQLIAPLT